MKIISSILASIVLLAVSANSQAVVIAFDSLETPGLQSMVSYSEAGYTFTGSTNNFATWGTDSTNYAGSAGLFNNTGDGITTLAADDGSLFSLNSMDLSEVYNQSSYTSTDVIFTALFSDGTTAIYTATLDLAFGYETFDFGGLFTNIKSVSWTQTYNYHQFDNLVINSAVPEPASILLMLIGLAGFRFMRTK